MASGLGEGSVQNQRYSENKVYTRKSYGKNAKPNPNPAPPNPNPPSPNTNPNPTPAPVTDDVSTTHLKPPSPAQPVTHPAQPVTVSDDEASSLKRGKPASEGPNGVSKSVALNFSTKSRHELREVRRRLTSELEQVRAFSKRLEVAAACAAATSAATPVAAPEAGYTQSQFSATDPETPVTLQQPVFSKRTQEVVVATNSAAFPVATPATVPPPKAPVTGSVPVPYRRQLSVSLSGTDNFPTESLEKRTPKANQLYNNSEFLLAKDRIPNESFKKSKPNGSKKHSLSSELDNNEKKVYSNAFKKCAALLSRLMKHKFGWVFNKPVDPVALQLHDYFTIITHPMDLGTIKTRLSKNWYKSPREYAEDVRLTFQNAMTYNPKGQDVHIMAEQLLQIFDEGWSAIETEMMYQLSYHSPPPVPPKKTALSVPPTDPRTLERSDSTVHPKSVPVPVLVQVPYIGRTPALKKPKAKDMNKRDMTFEEKRRLSNNLQNLPQEKLDVVVQIIKRKNLSMNQHDDEIEVDIDSMDVETLWELDRFVTNYKKNLSKHKRKAELAILARRGIDQNTPRDVQDNRVQETNAGGELPNRGDDGYVATSDAPDQEGEKGENGSRSSSSSSSSSSGSSSSDSDSDSSSAYASDAPPQ